MKIAWSDDCSARVARTQLAITGRGPSRTPVS
jgi:hypothetical protein